MNSEGISRIESPLLRAREYLDVQVKRARALYDNESDGKFAKEYDKTLEGMMVLAQVSVDGRIGQSGILQDTRETSPDYQALRQILIADKLFELMQQELTEYQEGKTPPSVLSV